ncbi:ribonuclease P protein component [candidate division TA06 bacterium]|uniref:Ribonuclease P protein component n=1 Tax=candidate division TA06 bacterium TaxID=2250710 RepID=A0A933MJ01_UNCT6|nr:ribonuclease P protein component [candidate division TA06 bacterium]
MDKIRQTYKKAERLKSEGDISGLFENGSRIRHQGLKLIYRFTPESTGCRAGFATKRQKGFGSVQRNLNKRRMCEAYRRAKHLIKPGFDLFFVAQRPLSYAQIESCLSQLLEKAGLLRVPAGPEKQC